MARHRKSALRSLFLTALLIPVGLWARGVARDASARRVERVRPGPVSLLAPTDAVPAMRVDPLPRGTRNRPVLVDVDALADPGRNGVIEIELFDGETLRVHRQRLESTGGSGFVWVGAAAGVGEASVFLSRRGDVVVGDIAAGPGEQYKLLYAGQGVHVLRRVDMDALGELLEPWPRGGILRPPLDAPPSRSVVPSADDCGTVDVMVLYTPAARVRHNGPQAIEAIAFLAVSETNQVYRNSQIDHRLSLVHIAELPFTESTTPDAWQNLRADLEAFEMDATAAQLRDKHGADLLSLLVGVDYKTSAGYYTGLGDYPQSALHPSAAHNVVASPFANYPSYTFAHEIGHQMGATHDWFSEGPTAGLYPHNRGHIAPSKQWRTVMSYPNGCSNCEVIPHHSNPDISYKGEATGVSGTTPTSCQAGTSYAAPCVANNAKVLNDTACGVAGYRATSPGRTDVFIKDTWSDTGLEPTNPDTVGADMWKSPDIWVRNEPDPEGLYPHISEPPVLGQTNQVYVKLRHGGASPASGTLRVYWAEANAGGFDWDPNANGGTYWHEIGNGTPVTLPPHATVSQAVPWIPTASGHVCLIARWTSTSDPMAAAETTNIGWNAQRNNNIAWRNVTVILLPKGQGAPAVAQFAVANPEGAASAVGLRFAAPGADGGDSILDHGAVTVDLGPSLAARWAAGGSLGTGIIDLGGGRLRMSDAEASVYGMQLDAEEWLVAGLEFQLDAGDDDVGRSTYHLEITQLLNDRAVGGLAYELRLLPTADAPAMIVGNVFDDVNANGVRDAAESGLAGRTVAAASPGGQAYSTQSGPGGGFELHVAPGDYTVAMGMPADWSQTWPPAGSYAATVGADERWPGFDYGFRQTSCAEPPEGLSAWWSLDEPDGSAAAKEWMGGHDLTVHGGRSFAPGMVGNALHLDGQADADSDYAEVADADALDVGRGDFSIDAWIRMPPDGSGPAERVIVEKLDSAPRGYSFSIVNGRLQLRLGDGSAPRVTSGPGATVPADDAWHLVAVTVDRDDAEGIRFYLDGQPFGQSGDPTGQAASASNESPLRIGSRTLFETPGLLFQGGIDEVELFGRALPSSEIQRIYGAGANGKCKPLAPTPVASVTAIPTAATSAPTATPTAIPTAAPTVVPTDTDRTWQILLPAASTGSAMGTAGSPDPAPAGG